MIREAIYNRMVQRGVSQTKLCNDVGLTVQNFNAFIRGSRGIPYVKLMNTMDYLKLTFGLDGGDGQSTLPPSNLNNLVKSQIMAKYKNTYYFAQQSGITGSTISSFVTGKRHMSYKNLEKVLNTLGISIVKRA